MRWTAGYVSDIPYSVGYYRELSPTFLRFAALGVGQVAGPTSSYLELGSGQGFGLALLAAAEPGVRFHGVDFNPEHIVTSRRFAGGAGLDNLEFEEASFEEVAERGTAGEFDRVVLHGILSWVSKATQDAVVAILRRRLAPGGIAYVSYNAMPGWAAMTPIQHLLRTLAERAPSGRSDARVDHALAAIETLRTGDARYFDQNPDVVARASKLAGHDRAYLVHEYLNEHWQPLYFSQVAAMLDPAKLSYLGSATIVDDLNVMAVPGKLHGAVEEAGGDIVWRETLRDFASNKRFRRDIYARGLPAPSRFDYVRALAASRYVLAVDPDRVSYTLSGPLGEVEGHRDVYEPVVRRLAESEVASFEELAALPAIAQRGTATLLQTLILLVQSGQVIPAAAGDSEAARVSCRRFNRFVLSALETGQVYGFLASPVGGTGIAVGNADLLALAALEAGCTNEEAIARHAFESLDRRGQRPMKDGQPIEDDAEALAAIGRDLGPIAASKRPIWRRLGIL